MQMSMFPHTVSIYRVTVETDPATLTAVTTNQITVLRGVLLDTSKGVGIRGKQPVNADEATLYVPFCTARELDISTDGSCFFIKGEIVAPDMDRETLEKTYGHMYSITRVEEMDYGGLPHWEIGGR